MPQPYIVSTGAYVTTSKPKLGKKIYVRSPVHFGQGNTTIPSLLSVVGVVLAAI